MRTEKKIYGLYDPCWVLLTQFQIHWRLFNEVSKDKKKYVFSTFVYEYSKLETIIDIMGKVIPDLVNADILRQALNRRHNIYLGVTQE